MNKKREIEKLIAALEVEVLVSIGRIKNRIQEEIANLKVDLAMLTFAGEGAVDAAQQIMIFVHAGIVAPLI